MKHVAFLTYPLIVTALTALAVGGCSSKGTDTSQSSASPRAVVGPGFGSVRNAGNGA